MIYIVLTIIIICILILIKNNSTIESFTFHKNKNKIAFIFLTIGDIKQIKIWMQFLKGNEDKYNIYVHPKYPNQINSVFKKYIINKNISTSWGDISLVDATNLLIEEALKDPFNKKIILVSDSCIPIKKFNYIYNIVLFDHKSWFNYYKPSSYNGGSREHIRRLLDLNYKIRKKTYITDQWMILDRKHALLLARNKHLIVFFRKPRLFPDEMYYITLLHMIYSNIKDELKFKMSNYQEYQKHNKITYAKWYDPTLNKFEKLHPIEFNIMNKEDILNLKHSRALFARKFSINSDIEKYWNYIIE